MRENRKWSNNCSSPKYENWRRAPSFAEDNLCTYVTVLMSGFEWNVAPCDSVTKMFLCEDENEFCSEFSYDAVPAMKGDAEIGTLIVAGTATVRTCSNLCDAISSDMFCWGFLFNDMALRCKLYDILDDPFYNDNYRSVAFDRTLYIRRCIYSVEVNMKSIHVPIYQSCGKSVVSKCSCPEIQSTTLDPINNSMIPSAPRGIYSTQSRTTQLVLTESYSSTPDDSTGKKEAPNKHGFTTNPYDVTTPEKTSTIIRQLPKSKYFNGYKD
ncbi:Hypothetical predicted protein [Mytilus galloprovincialis]|uniref:C-type lectin domain-containing protein n=1 Tax=Mytilus galloprovincialis TaxID=29158 RepID=A0A8B6CRB0_MYTGA|nr:Hypothetical predicted protein [Mytilus galloprovincialis]